MPQEIVERFTHVWMAVWGENSAQCCRWKKGYVVDFLLRFCLGVLSFGWSDLCLRVLSGLKWRGIWCLLKILMSVLETSAAEGCPSFHGVFLLVQLKTQWLFIKCMKTDPDWFTQCCSCWERSTIRWVEACSMTPGIGNLCVWTGERLSEWTINLLMYSLPYPSDLCHINKLTFEIKMQIFPLKSVS